MLSVSPDENLAAPPDESLDHPECPEQEPQCRTSCRGHDLPSCGRCSLAPCRCTEGDALHVMLTLRRTSWQIVVVYEELYGTDTR